MEKTNFTQQFAQRLRDAMIAAGYDSSRSASGVCIHTLSEMTGYSIQICRKYLRGEALPEPNKLAEIAKKLNVSAGWLMFGEEHIQTNTSEGLITISPSLLLYLFCQIQSLNALFLQDAKTAPFFVTLAQDITLINVSEEQSKKIIDLAISSMKHFGAH